MATDALSRLGNWDALKFDAGTIKQLNTLYYVCAVVTLVL